MRTEWAVVINREGDVMVTPHEAVQAAADELGNAFRGRERASGREGGQIDTRDALGVTERADLASPIPSLGGKRPLSVTDRSSKPRIVRFI